MGIWTNKSEQTAVQEAEVVVEPVTKVPTAIIENAFEIKKEGLPVRCGGDRIYLLLKGKKHWVVNAEVYSRLGFRFGDERDIDPESLQLFPEGEPLA